MIDLKFLERVLDLLNESNADTIEIRKWPWSTSVKVSRNSVPPSGQVTYQVSGPPAGNNPSPAPAAPAQVPESTDKSAASAEPAEEAPKAENLVDIKSPMVGTFYAQPEPGADPYVKNGDRITVGQTLCIIEAMKIMNPLDSEIAGVVREIAVEDAQPVEFGQTLFRVDPNG